MLQDIESINNHSLNPEQHYLIQALDGGFCVEAEAMWKDEWKPNVTITSDHAKHYECLIFININSSCKDRTSQWLSCEFTIWLWQKFSPFEKDQSIFSWRGYLSLFKSFATWSFITWDENWPFFYLVWKMLNFFMHYLPDKKLRYSHVPGYGTDWLNGIVVNHDLYSQQQIQEFFYLL